MHGMDSFMLKNCTTSAPDTRKATVHLSEVLFFSRKLFFGGIKLSDLEGRNSYLPMAALIMSKLYFLLITTMKQT